MQVAGRATRGDTQMRTSPSTEEQPLCAALPNGTPVSNEHGVPATVSVLIAWWCLGLFNNISFVIMNASAKNITASSVGMVYLVNSLPSLLIRLTAPYWFDRVTYGARMLACFLLFVSGFTLVAVATSPSLKLLGVALAAAQCGLGETTLLALSTRYPPSALTAWASGTGAAGIFGYLYVIALERWLGLPSRTILLLGPVLAVAYYATFRAFGVPRDPRHDIDAPGPGTPARRSSAGTLGAGRNTNSPAHPRREVEGVSTRTRQEVEAPSAGTHGARGAELSNADRLRLTLSLYPWALPLILVYFAEYALQAGTWSAIGFPVTDRASRNAFYQNANWCYQIGVLVSRSSGSTWKPGLKVLWIMPVMQTAILVFSTLNAASHWWYDQSLLALSVVVGLLGGAVYVNGFRLVSESIPKDVNELATAAAAVSTDIGTTLGELMGLGIQAWLYVQNGISAASD